MQRAKRPAIELRYAEERTAPSSLDESFGSVGDASEPEGERAASFEAGAAQQRRDTFRRSKKGGKGGATRPRQQRRASDQTGGLEKRFAAVRLGSPASSEGSSIDVRDFVSPSGKASSLESVRARSDSYHLGTDTVSTRHDDRRTANRIGKKKLARADKKRRGE